MFVSLYARDFVREPRQIHTHLEMCVVGLIARNLRLHIKRSPAPQSTVPSRQSSSPAAMATPIARAVCLLLTTSTAHGWTTISQGSYGAQVLDIKRQTAGNATSAAPTKLLGFLWSFPADAGSRAGLGGGISWAWDPAICDRLLPKFRENFASVQFVGCEELKAAVHRSFASWSDNHALISFTEVTEECAKLGQLSATCPLVEVWLTLRAVDNGPANVSSLTIQVSESQEAGSSTAATAQPRAKYTSTFRATNGRVAGRRVVETVGATVAFNPKLCWYLDSTFCSWFHSLKRLGSSPEIVLAVGQIVIFGLWVRNQWQCGLQRHHV